MMVVMVDVITAVQIQCISSMIRREIGTCNIDSEEKGNKIVWVQKLRIIGERRGRE